MDQETYNGIIKVLQRGAGVMAAEYCQAFTAVVAELQKRVQAEQAAAKKAEQDTAKKANNKKEG